MLLMSFLFPETPRYKTRRFFSKSVDLIGFTVNESEYSPSIPSAFISFDEVEYDSFTAKSCGRSMVVFKVKNSGFDYYFDKSLASNFLSNYTNSTLFYSQVDLLTPGLFLVDVMSIDDFFTKMLDGKTFTKLKLNCILDFSDKRWLNSNFFRLLSIGPLLLQAKNLEIYSAIFSGILIFMDIFTVFFNYFWRVFKKSLFYQLKMLITTLIRSYDVRDFVYSFLSTISKGFDCCNKYSRRVEIKDVDSVLKFGNFRINRDNWDYVETFQPDSQETDGFSFNLGVSKISYMNDNRSGQTNITVTISGKAPREIKRRTDPYQRSMLTEVMGNYYKNGIPNTCLSKTNCDGLTHCGDIEEVWDIISNKPNLSKIKCKGSIVVSNYDIDLSGVSDNFMSSGLRYIINNVAKINSDLTKGNSRGSKSDKKDKEDSSNTIFSKLVSHNYLFFGNVPNLEALFFYIVNRNGARKFPGLGNSQKKKYLSDLNKLLSSFSLPTIRRVNVLNDSNALIKVVNGEIGNVIVSTQAQMHLQPSSHDKGFAMLQSIKSSNLSKRVHKMNKNIKSNLLKGEPLGNDGKLFMKNLNVMENKFTNTGKGYISYKQALLTPTFKGTDTIKASGGMGGIINNPGSNLPGAQSLSIIKQKLIDTPVVRLVNEITKVDYVKMLKDKLGEAVTLDTNDIIREMEAKSLEKYNSTSVFHLEVKELVYKDINRIKKLIESGQNSRAVSFVMNKSGSTMSNLTRDKDVSDLIVKKISELIENGDKGTINIYKNDLKEYNRESELPESFVKNKIDRDKSKMVSSIIEGLQNRIWSEFEDNLMKNPQENKGKGEETGTGSGCTDFHRTKSIIEENLQKDLYLDGAEREIMFGWINDYLEFKDLEGSISKGKGASKPISWIKGGGSKQKGNGKTSSLNYKSSGLVKLRFKRMMEMSPGDLNLQKANNFFKNFYKTDESEIKIMEGKLIISDRINSFLKDKFGVNIKKVLYRFVSKELKNWNCLNFDLGKKEGDGMGYVKQTNREEEKIKNRPGFGIIHFRSYSNSFFNDQVKKVYNLDRFEQSGHNVDYTEHFKNNLKKFLLLSVQC